MGLEKGARKKGRQTFYQHFRLLHLREIMKARKEDPGCLLNDYLL